MQIWRVEHPGDNRGPFRSEFGPDGYGTRWTRKEIEEFLDAFDAIPPEWVPGPVTEITSLGKLSDWRQFLGDDPHNPDIEFGVARPDAINKWFPDAMRTLAKKHGFRLRCFDVPDEGALPLRTQVAFKRHMARLVEERELL